MRCRFDRGQIRAVMFDYYFTLAKPEPTDWGALARAVGLDLVDHEVERLRVDYPSRLPPRPDVPFAGDVPSFRSYWDQWVAFGDGLFAELGGPQAGEEYARVRRRAHAEAQLFDDTRSAVDGLRDLGYVLGVLSDADEDFLQDNLTGHGLILDAVVCSQALRCYKPHRSTFEAICVALAVQPDEALFVGDSPISDIEGARRAGLNAVWINRRGLVWPPDLPPPATVGSLTDLAAGLASQR